jgi:phosphatidylinositol alpha 1,6-mannosyltransferase
VSLRVVIVTESFLPSLNGVTNSVLRILDTFRQKGFEALIISPTAPTPKHLGFNVIKTASFPVMQFQVAVPGLWLQNTIEEFQPDVVHVASPFMLGAQAILAAERLGIPTVAVYQTELTGYMDRYNLSRAKPLLDRMVANIHSPATLNLAPTKQTADYLLALGVPSVAIWGRGVDLDLYHPNRKRVSEALALKREWAPNGEHIIGYVGRIAAEKQVHRFAELAKVPNTRIVIVGDGPERKRLETEFAHLPINFVGKRSGLDLAYAYAAMDMFVHFGTEETFGQTIQEAQAAGLPLVAPRSGGPIHLVDHGSTGFLAHPTKPGAFNEFVEALAKSPDLRAKVGEQARRAVLNKSWEANNAQLIEHYQSAIKANEIRKATSVELA